MSYDMTDSRIHRNEETDWDCVMNSLASRCFRLVLWHILQLPLKPAYRILRSAIVNEIVSDVGSLQGPPPTVDCDFKNGGNHLTSQRMSCIAWD